MDRRKETLERINNIVIPSDLKNINIGYIPLGREVVLQQFKEGSRKTAAGLIIAESINASSPLGRIVAFGPDCSDFIKLGLLVRFNPMLNIKELVNGVELIFVDEHGIRGVVEDETTTHFHPKFPTPDEIRRGIAKEVINRSREITDGKIAEIEEKFSKPRSKRK